MNILGIGMNNSILPNLLKFNTPKQFMLVIRIIVKIVGVFYVFNLGEFQKLQVNFIQFNYSFRIKVQVSIHN